MKSPSLCGIAFWSILLGGLAFMVTPPTYAAVISDIVISNHSSNSVTISWITDVISDGTVHYGTTPTLGLSASDSRADDDTHWVQITGLDPETSYFFEVVSGGTTDDNNGSKYSFQTTKVGTGTTYTVFGFVWQADGSTPAEGAIVYLTLTHNGVTSYPLSGLVASNGAWSLDLGNLKDPTINDVLSPTLNDIIQKRAQGAGDGATGWHAYSYTGSSPQQLQPDQALPVELSTFTGSYADNQVVISWRTLSEIRNTGWHVYRAENVEGPYERITSHLLPGAGTTAEAHDYQFVDSSVTEGRTYYYYVEDVSYGGLRHPSIKLEVSTIPPLLQPQQGIRPFENRLLQNYPNPFNPETWIPFELADNARVQLRIFDVRGQLVREFVLGNQSAGSYLEKGRAVYWDGKDSTGQLVASGVYLYQLRAGKFTATRRLLLQR